MLDVQVGDRRILWSEGVLRVLERHRQRGRASREAGGILLGEVSETAVLVSRVTAPSSRDRRSRFGFVRDRKVAQVIVDHEHLNSEGRVTYIGEWHTHPERSAEPSAVDERMIREQLASNVVPAGFLLLVVLGLEVDYVGVLYDNQLSGTTVVLA